MKYLLIWYTSYKESDIMNFNFLKKKTDEQTVNVESNYRKHGDNTLIVVVSFVIAIIIISFSIYNLTISNQCRTFEKDTSDAAFNYAINNNLLPSYEGTSIKIDLSNISGWDNKFRGSACGGSLTIIKNETGYAKVINLTDCNSCTSSKLKKSAGTTKFSENKILLKVDVDYNYRNRQINYTAWTDWFESSLINPTANETYAVNLPYDETKLPKIPTDGVLISYDVEKKTFYSYRDQSWKFYKTANSDYTNFSSTKPVGYTYKDTKTEIETAPSEWSLNYPDEADYRTISTKTAYKFYYLDNKNNKIYYNNGEYTAEITDETLKKLYNKKEKETVKMYSYVDKKWRWYNGVERGYSGYMKEANSSYTYKDTELTKYSSWSSFSETTTMTSENQTYRQEKTDVHTRYRIKYSFDSVDQLSDYLSINDFELATGRTVSDMQADEKIKVLVRYTYYYAN